MGILDKLLDLGATFDWITPAASLLEDEPGFVAPRDCAATLTNQLRSRGIKLKHPQIVGGQFVFDVAEKDAAQVRRILQRL